MAGYELGEFGIEPTPERRQNTFIDQFEWNPKRMKHQIMSFKNKPNNLKNVIF